MMTTRTTRVLVCRHCGFSSHLPMRDHPTHCQKCALPAYWRVADEGEYTESDQLFLKLNAIADDV